MPAMPLWFVVIVFAVVSDESTAPKAELTDP
jgi:hypothetical protein